MAKNPPAGRRREAGHDRQKKLAEVLRANLRKRKDQARRRSADAAAKGPENLDPTQSEDR